MLIKSDGDHTSDAQPRLELPNPGRATAKRQDSARLEESECRDMWRAVLSDQIAEFFRLSLTEMDGDQGRRIDDDQPNVPRSL